MNMQEKCFRLAMQSAESVPRDGADPVERGPPEGAQDDAGQVQEEVPRSGATHGLDEGPHAAVDGQEGESEGQSQGSEQWLLALICRGVVVNFIILDRLTKLPKSYSHITPVELTSDVPK